MDLTSIVSIEKIEDNLEWLGIAAGFFADHGLRTPEVIVNRALEEFHPPDLGVIKNWLLENPKTSSVFKGGLVMTVAGMVGEKVLGGLGSRISRAAKKFGTGQMIGVAAYAVTGSTYYHANSPVSGPPFASMNGVYSP